MISDSTAAVDIPERVCRPPFNVINSCKYEIEIPVEERLFR
jgi:hypothetical protein